MKDKRIKSDFFTEEDAKKMDPTKKTLNKFKMKKSQGIVNELIAKMKQAQNELPPSKCLMSLDANNSSFTFQADDQARTITLNKQEFEMMHDIILRLAATKPTPPFL